MRKLRTIAQSSGRVYSLLCSPADRLIAICNERGALELIDPSDDGARKELASPSPSPSPSDKLTLPKEFTRDGKYLLATIHGSDRVSRISVCIDQTLAVYSVPEGDLVASWSVEEVAAAALSPDGRTVVTTHPDGMRFWSVFDLQSSPVHVVTGGRKKETPGLLRSPRFSPDGRYVVAAGKLTGRIEIVDSTTKQPVGHLAGHTALASTLCFSPDGKRLASDGSENREALKLWDFEARRQTASIVGDDGWSGHKVEWLPDGNSIMLVTSDSRVNIWRVPSFAEIERKESAKINFALEPRDGWGGRELLESQSRMRPMPSKPSVSRMQLDGSGTAATRIVAPARNRRLEMP